MTTESESESATTGQAFCVRCDELLVAGAAFCHHCGRPADPDAPESFMDALLKTAWRKEEQPARDLHALIDHLYAARLGERDTAELHHMIDALVRSAREAGYVRAAGVLAVLGGVSSDNPSVSEWMQPPA
jgi:hypothetical protein